MQQSKQDDNSRLTERSRADNSTYPKGAVSYSRDSLVVKGSLVFQIKFIGKNPALRLAAKRVCLESMTFC